MSLRAYQRKAIVDIEVSLRKHKRTLFVLPTAGVIRADDTRTDPEDWDCPEVRCIILARPTRSIVRYLQSVGRAMRPDDTRPIILDHSGNVRRHGLPDEDKKGLINREGEHVKACGDCGNHNHYNASACGNCGAELEIKYTDGQLQAEIITYFNSRRLRGGKRGKFDIGAK